MGITDKARAFNRKFKLDSHHAIERFGVFFGIFAVTGAIVISASGALAYQAGRDSLSQTALYTSGFKTSKTNLDGTVDGVYTNKSGNKALVMMHFSPTAQISYNAADYRAFLLGSDTSLNSEPVSTSGIKGSFYAFGSTGYIGLLLDADRPFDRQVLNLTVRANAELTTPGAKQPQSSGKLAGDETFSKYDQWRVFFNPGASGVQKIAALDALAFDPAQAYYEVALKEKEAEARDALDQKLVEMRTNLTQIQSYTSELQTTKIDGLFLRPPTVPVAIATDEITGFSAAEAKDGVSTLALETKHVVPGGFDLNWRAGNVYDGYLDALVPAGQSYAQFFTKKRDGGSDPTSRQVSDMQWTLSDGTSLTRDYQSSDVTMRPLMNIMNNLSQAYQNYSRNKSQYESDLSLDLLRLDVSLRDVQSNGTVRGDKDFLTTLH
ncbi:hypothetical protein [Streptomyces albipurpureus]|uniref:Uncharacterized protein n=1 Tax=Streptomyces albipurpureus TaxID=2897419 RepID=A0ABT0UVV5_9ACTN|nr:hypothetical protein [Streptomyces sp. CWNU-1]MCM2392707.1 hypothetical protein [Streptomyces sp. CWNU-1]